MIGGRGGLASRQEVENLRQQLHSLQTQVSRTRERAVAGENNITKLFSSRRFRRRTVQLPFIPVASPPDVVFTWREPLPVDVYFIEPDWPLPTGLTFTLKEMTPAAVVLTMTTTVMVNPNTPMTLTAWC